MAAKNWIRIRLAKAYVQSTAYRRRSGRLPSRRRGCRVWPSMCIPVVWRAWSASAEGIMCLWTES